MRCLDLYCGGFGAGYGWSLAGFDVTGVDRVRRQAIPEGVTFIKADVLDVLEDKELLRSFDVIHASPPCQTHSRTKHLRDAQGKGTDKVDLIDQTRDALERAGVPYVIENVEGAPLRQDLLLCGSMFPELHVHDKTGRRWLKRHRIFESNVDGLTAPRPCCTCQAGCAAAECLHRLAGARALGVYGSRGDDIPSGGQTCRTVEQARRLMGIDWMGWSALVEAIPPAYTYHIGRQVREALS